MVPSCQHLLNALVLAVLLAMMGCADSGTGPDSDDDSAPDDDDSAGDDDDDSAAGDDDDLSDLGIRFVTFAAMLDGSPDGTSRPGAESTGINGSFQFVYWSDLDSGKIVCRQRYLFEATARFGAADLATCSDCGGHLSIVLVQGDDNESHSDNCPPLPASVDLSFLLTAADIVTPADFREMSLVSLDRLQEVDWQLSEAGMPASEIDQSYEEAGLDAYWIAMISSHGWLSAEAGLGDTANRWDADAALLPMFVAYRNPSENPAGWALDGSCFLSTLWVVRVGASAGAEPLP
jgi:hypothetical protein